MAGSSSLEAAVVEGRPLVDISTCTVYKYDRLQGVDGDLSFGENIPPAHVTSPLKLPPPVHQSLPGGSSMMERVRYFEESQSSTASSPSASVSSRQDPRNKTRQHGQRKRKPVGGKKSQPPKAKRAYRKKRVVKPADITSPTPSFTESADSEESDDSGHEAPSNSMCSFRACLAEFEEGERWVKCDYCENWACPKCSKTGKLPNNVVKKIKFKCEKCRNKKETLKH